QKMSAPSANSQSQDSQKQNSDSLPQTQSQPAQSIPANQQSADSNDKPADGQGKVAGTSNDRLFGALPNFLTLQAGQKVPPLSAKDKYKVVALGTFDKVNFAWWGAIAAVNQADNADPAYGQGWKAYAKRYGTAAGDSIIENFMVGAVYPSLIHQDPRF